MNKVGAALLLVLSGLLVACNNGGGAATPKKPVYPPFITVRGDLTVSGSSNVRGNLSQCAGAGSFADLQVGAPVAINTARGKPVGVGKINLAIGTNVYQDQLDQCTFQWVVPNLPRKKAYFISVAQQKPYPTTFAALYASTGLTSMVLPSTTTTTFPSAFGATTTVPPKKK